MFSRHGLTLWRLKENHNLKKKIESKIKDQREKTEMCTIQSLPIEIIRYVFYEYLIPSPYSEFINPNRANRNIFPFGRKELRNFLSCTRGFRGHWSRELIYFNLSEPWSLAYVQDIAFHDRVVSLVRDPMRQIGLIFFNHPSWEAISDEMVHQNCNHVHYVTFNTSSIGARISLIDNVHILNYAGAWNVKDISSFNQTVQLSLTSAHILPEITERDLQKVHYLVIRFAPFVTRLPSLPCLERLQLRNLANLKEIDVLGCPNLKEVSLSEINIEDLAPFRNIQKLWFHNIHQVTDISMLTHVKELALYEMGNVSQGWAALQEHCEKLIIDTNYFLVSFSGCVFKKLRCLELTSCSRLTSVREVNQVEEIILVSCAQLVDITPFKLSVGRVKKISISSCSLICDISPLYGIPEVILGNDLSEMIDYSVLGNHKGLTIVGDEDMMVVPPIANVTHLELSQWPLLQDLTSAGFLQQLTKLTLKECTRIKSFVRLPNLMDLYLDGLYIRKFTTGDDFPNLQVLKVSNCFYVQEIDVQHHLLKWFEVVSCIKLSKITMRSKEQRHWFSLRKEQACTVVYAE
jgi:Leucine-rich repeat (LRR) protein